jgi:fructose-bisphosphate aldolase, class I
VLATSSGVITMPNNDMNAQMTGEAGFIAALDQSGGSTPGALRLYGIPDTAYANEAEMFALIHAMRVRVMTAPAFTGDKVIGTILFERTMNGTIAGKPAPAFLWKDRSIVPFLKVDQGLQEERDGVNLMKPIQGLDTLLTRALELGIYGTKARSTIRLASRSGVAAIVDQQFELAAQIASRGLMPIVETEVLITSTEKKAAEALLLAALTRKLDDLPPQRQVMLKLTIPSIPNLYEPLIAHKAVARLVALSGGYTRAEACLRLSHNRGMIASFSRALLEGLTRDMSDAAFDAQLKESIDEIYTASTVKN